MKVSLSNLLRWGNRKEAAAETPKKAMARADQPSAATADALPVEERRRSIRWPKNGLGKMSWIEEDGSWKTISVWLKNSGDGGIGVVSRKPVAINRSVWLISNQGEDSQGLIRYCTKSQDGFQVGFERIKAKVAKPETTLGGAQLKWLEKSGKLVLTPVSIRNAGEGQIEVVTAKAVPAPAIMLLSGKDVRCLATAKACHKRGNRFLVEMEVVSDAYKHPAVA